MRNYIIIIFLLSVKLFINLGYACNQSSINQNTKIILKSKKKLLLSKYSCLKKKTSASRNLQSQVTLECRDDPCTSGNDNTYPRRRIILQHVINNSNCQCVFVRIRPHPVSSQHKNRQLENFSPHIFSNLSPRLS